ncbi:MAG: AraC family transcriptional regulator [Eubacteriales bacterium]|nr:AraC family transcriptional regulator [Eubacteriales bacterium]
MRQDTIDNSALQQTNYFLLECLERFVNIEITCFGEGRFFDVREQVNFNPLRENEEYRNHLIEICEQRKIPAIVVDAYHVAYTILRYQNADQSHVYFFIGPMSLRPMDKVMLHRFYREHGLKHADEKPVPVMSLSRILLLTQIAAGLIYKRKYTDRELLDGNQLAGELAAEQLPDKIHFTMEQEEMDSCHHTYQEERKLLDCVKNGQTEEALRLNLAMDDTLGSMSADYLEQIRKTVIVAITLNTRAAIEGGISPYEAYQISDYYMQKLDLCVTEVELTACKNAAIRTLAERVNKHLYEKKTSDYVERCVSYIEQHYREHIYLDELAEKNGISPNYLSKIFSRDMGMTFQEYVLKVRTDRAANLLAYSEAGIAEIGDYVNFPNQSYFGRVFKKYKGMTPKAYRSRYKPREFNEIQQ